MIDRGNNMFKKYGKWSLLLSWVPFIGDPITFVGINSIGLRRNGYKDSQINNIQDIYRIIFQKKLNTTQALEILEKDMEMSLEKREVIDFIKKSDRGIIKGYF